MKPREMIKGKKYFSKETCCPVVFYDFIVHPDNKNDYFLFYFQMDGFVFLDLEKIVELTPE